MASPLDAPPPSPLTMSSPPPGTGFGGLSPSPGNAPGSLSPEVIQGILKMGQEVNDALLKLASVIPKASMHFSVARQSVQAGMAKFLEAASSGQEAIATSPTELGKPWPGGGYTSI